ncbi:P-type conjugative transfer protein TrbL [Methylotuvimicrobium sp. KM1]|uniref:P-type conjugative transfer protein TrbL n=1 Tax=Methylotuvimicrobium sp. KM1 TaxID=3377707 RepID=UPI00384BBDF5
MRISANSRSAVLLLWLAFFALDARAAIDSSDVMDSVLTRYQSAVVGWAGVITSSATWLFWTLVLISMVWTFGMMLLRKADIGEFFAEFVRFTIFTGFFWWLLINGPAFADSIMASLRQLGGNATGLGSSLSPSGIVDVGFAIFDRVVDQSSVWSPVNSAVGIIIAVVILVILALVSVNMLVLLVAGWILAYAGVFFLGFGGSRWTSDMAINYYKTVLGVAAQLFVIVLIVGIGNTFLDDYFNRMNVGITIKEMGVMLIVSVILLMLVNKLPNLVAGIISGASIGGVGIGQFGSGAAIGAAGMATAAAATGGAMIVAGAANAAGGAQAVMAAFSKANENVSSSSDVLSSMWGGGGNSSVGDGGVSSALSAGNTPFAQAAGFSNSSDSMWSRGEDRDAKRQTENGTDQAKSDGKQNSGSTESTGTAKTGQGGNRQSTSTQNGGFMTAAATSGKIAVDAGVNLAKGIADVAMAKAGERIADTTPGKIADAIKGNGNSSETNIEFAGNSLSGESDTHSEIAAFVNRGNSGTST